MAEKKEVTTQNKQELTMSGYFTSELERIAGALPEDFNKQRFALGFISMIQDHPELQKYPKEELATAVVRAAQDNLDVLNGEVYIHEGRNGKIGYDISYKGMRKMAIERSVKPVDSIIAKLIKEGDTVDEEIVNGKAHIHYKSKFGNNGAIIGVMAICTFKDGSEIYEIMTKEEIDACKAKSRNSGAWRDFYGEQAKKSVIRRLCKQITLKFTDKRQADDFVGANEFNLDDPKEQAQADIEQNANVIDIDSEDIQEVTIDEDGQTSFVTEE
jgi:recombination protein RecT